MQTIRTGYNRQIFFYYLLTLVMIVLNIGMTDVFAQGNELSYEKQLDSLLNTATSDLDAERWEDAVHNLERAKKLAVSLPGEFHYLFGKALLKTGNYDYSLSNLTDYITLEGREGKYFEEAINLIVEARNKQDEKRRPTVEPHHQVTKAAEEIEDGMVFVKGGCFEMGDIFNTGGSDEKPVHTVCVSGFYLGRTEVTQKQWAYVTGKNPSKFQCEDCPVERVSWDDIQEFIKKLNEKTGMNYRLPTEAEWEYAARSGGLKQQWAGTNNEGEIGEYAWYGSTAEGRTHSVGSKQPNGIGLYDMMGNVWEWCSDWYDKRYYDVSPAKDPQGPSEGHGRVLRGGGWRSKDKGLRTTDRNDFIPTEKKFSDIGFRLARCLQY
ncbi:hypothetical protein SCALIN_C01_0175 [Candidatus Scalindua japonica]|uniref:Sulfatase-modifying factor enzyme-like domain-containing protein n=1 Tax=Candidatus Scalindua japonica TaxID=1284222 RepID=A0A286TTP9_9BACT|nr:formylglycine-generating enzyme family protein [Candidatus Scalindua japonica]GAX59244.1 hypothetical protein SCALIN_C01_0175 [Candidatus Scalindua japonica]